MAENMQVIKYAKLFKNSYVRFLQEGRRHWTVNYILASNQALSFVSTKLWVLLLILDKFMQTKNQQNFHLIILIYRGDNLSSTVLSLKIPAF